VIFDVATSVVIFFVVLPVTYWYITRLINAALGLSEDLMVRPASLILTGMSWSLGLFWITWAYSYLLFVGQGSPLEAFGAALEPTKRLVTTGPYAYVRNPMEFGFLLILLGVGFLENSITGLIMAPISAIIAALYLKIFEEKLLLRRFGVAYEHYREHVPMLIPNPSAYVPPQSI
jgi:protein-S-isoprenylcysteine O-methyltransferase Ste14